MTRLPALMLMLAILTTASLGFATDKKNDKKDDRRSETKKHDRDDDRHDVRHGKPPQGHPHPGARAPFHGGPKPPQFGGPRPQHGGPKPPQFGGPHLHHAGPKPGKPCPCDQSAVYKIDDCRPALTSQGALNFMRVFESAAAKGVENATIRAMNAAKVPPTQTAAPCVTPVLPSAGGPPPRGR